MVKHRDFQKAAERITLRSEVRDTIPAFEIESGENSELSLKDRYDYLVRFIGKRQWISTVNKVRIIFSLVGFDDGTFWSYRDSYFKYDHNNPGQQIKLIIPELISFINLQEKIDGSRIKALERVIAFPVSVWAKFYVTSQECGLPNYAFNIYLSIPRLRERSIFRSCSSAGASFSFGSVTVKFIGINSSVGFLVPESSRL